jgi:hypothetical protein
MQDTQRVGYKYPRGISFRRSVIFSVGFVAGAWWASRARFDDSCCMEVDANRNHDHVSGSETASVYRLHPVPISVANAAVNSLRH